MNDQVKRPGISPDYLTVNQVRPASVDEAKRLVGTDTSGLLIPYHTRIGDGIVPVHDPDNTHFHRLRRNVLNSDHKYHQRKGTGIHAYIPWGTFERPTGQDLICVEGEFKAMSLSDPGAPFSTAAVGLSGFFGFHVKAVEGRPFELAPELVEVRHALRPARLHYLGDNDTALNYDFAIAATRLKSIVRTSVFLPRIGLDEPKGIDDCREQMGSKFGYWFQNILEQAIEVEDEMEPDTIALMLLRNQVNRLDRLMDSAKQKAVERIIKLAARCDETVADEMLSLVKKPLGIGKTVLSKKVEAARREWREQQQAALQDRLRPKVQTYFYNGSNYWRRNSDLRYTQLTGGENMLNHLAIEQGVGNEAAKVALYMIQSEQQVGFAGRVAGYQAGPREEGGGRILVTEGPTFIEPKRYESWTVIRDALEGLLGKNRDRYFEHQWSSFVGWLQQARRAVLNPETHLPGQLLGLLGPVQTGKSFTQEHIITPALGGRQIDPSDYLAGRTPFNDSIWGTEHLLMCDATVDADDRSRDRFRAQLKRLIANEGQTVSRRYQSQTSLRPRYRITLSANLDSTSIRVIPKFDSSMRDKIMLLRCWPATGLPGSDPAERTQFMNAIKAAIPGFLAYVDEFKVPEEYQEPRFGVAVFHHPDLLHRLNEGDPVRSLTCWLESWFSEGGGCLEGNAASLHEKLEGKFGGPFVDLIPDARALGRYLAEVKVSDGWSQRIDDSQKVPYGDQRNYSKVWTISPTPANPTCAVREDPGRGVVQSPATFGPTALKVV